MEIIREDVYSEETIDMIANGSADISLLALRQTLDRMEKVDFSHPTNFLYFGYVVKEDTHIEVEDYILNSFKPAVSLKIHRVRFPMYNTDYGRILGQLRHNFLARPKVLKR